MLKKYINSIIFFSKLNFRNPLYIISVIFGLFYLGVMVYTYSSSAISNPGNILQLSSFLIQGSMLVFMLLGYQSITVETRNTTRDLFLTIPNSFRIKIISNYLFILLSNMIFCIFSILLFLIVFDLSGYNFSIFHTKSIYFIFIYWFMPAIISSLIGVLVGIMTNKKISYSILIIMWILLSPMNVYFSYTLFRLMGYDFLPGFLHLGVPNPKMSYNSFSGFIFTEEDLINKIIWIVLLLLLILFFFIFRTWKFRSFRTITSLLIIILIFVTTTKFIHLDSKSNPTKYNGRNIEELNYYAEADYIILNEGLDYKITDYEIELEIIDNLKASVEIFFSEEETGNKNFSLYHGFEINNVEDMNGNKIDFEQEGDFVQVKLEQATKGIKMNYTGNSSPFMDANKHISYLPFYFAWIPLKSPYPAMKYMYNSNHRLPNQASEPANYVLHFESEHEVITNLNKADEGKYQGTNKTGISLIYGELTTKKINGYNITYPLTWENSMEGTNSYMNKLKAAFETTKDIFQLENTILPTNILFIPGRGPNDILPSETIWFHEGEQLIILIDPYEHHDETTLDSKSKLIPYQITGALLWKNEKIVHQNENIPTVFNAFVGTYINKKNGGEEPFYSEEDFWIGEVLLIESKENQEIIQKLSSLLSNSSNEDTEKLFRNWYSLMQNPNVTWNDIKQMIKELKAERG